MKILITGASGQLGSELSKRLSSRFQVTALTKEQLNITNQQKVASILGKYRPHIIIHAAAYTNVDQCESSRKTAFEVNGVGTGIVANEAQKIGAKIFYISSDYVFNGETQRPYEVGDNPNPQSIYGMSKWMGERLIQTILPESTIIRTSWLYGHHGKNFVKTMLKFAKENKEVKVVNDQIGSPTYTVDLVRVIEQLISKSSGIYHASNSGSCSWFEFARTIFEKAGYNPELVTPISSEEFSAPAQRPSFSVLNNNRLIEEGIAPIRRWDKALDEFIRREQEND